MDQTHIPPQLKFLMSNIKSVIHTQLTPDNYPLWKSQIGKLFAANGFYRYLDGTKPKPDRETLDESGNVNFNPDYNLWMLVDQNLAAALYSTISASLLPYVIDLDSCCDIWHTIEKRLQLNNRSKVLQLKNELHHMQMGEKTMMQYLSDIKEKCDAIAASGSILTA